MGIVRNYWIFILGFAVVAAIAAYKQAQQDGRKSGYAKCAKQVK